MALPRTKNPSYQIKPKEDYYVLMVAYDIVPRLFKCADLKSALLTIEEFDSQWRLAEQKNEEEYSKVSTQLTDK